MAEGEDGHLEHLARAGGYQDLCARRCQDHAGDGATKSGTLLLYQIGLRWVTHLGGEDNLAGNCLLDWSFLH